MINIYTKKECIPNGLKYIHNTSGLFFAIDINFDDEFVRNVISSVDKGKVLDSMFFEDRFGCKLPLTYLSTTSRCLICAKYGPKNYVYNFDEVGGIQFNFLKYIEECNIFVNRTNFEIDVLGATSVNGTPFECGDDAMFYIDTGEVSYYYGED